MAVCERGQKSWCVKREMSDVSREYLTFHVWRLTFDVYRLTFIVSPFTIAHSPIPLRLPRPVPCAHKKAGRHDDHPQP